MGVLAERLGAWLGAGPKVGWWPADGVFFKGNGPCDEERRECDKRLSARGVSSGKMRGFARRFPQAGRDGFGVISNLRRHRKQRQAPCDAVTTAGWANEATGSARAQVILHVPCRPASERFRAARLDVEQQENGETIELDDERVREVNSFVGDNCDFDIQKAMNSPKGCQRENPSTSRNVIGIENVLRVEKDAEFYNTCGDEEILFVKADDKHTKFGRKDSTSSLSGEADSESFATAFDVLDISGVGAAEVATLDTILGGECKELSILDMAEEFVGSWETQRHLCDPLDALFSILGVGILKRRIVDKLNVQVEIFLESENNGVASKTDKVSLEQQKTTVKNGENNANTDRKASNLVEGDALQKIGKDCGKMANALSAEKTVMDCVLENNLCANNSLPGANLLVLELLLPIGRRRMYWDLGGYEREEEDPDCGTFWGRVEQTTVNLIELMDRFKDSRALPTLRQGVDAFGGDVVSALRQTRHNAKGIQVSEVRLVLPHPQWERVLCLCYEVWDAKKELVNKTVRLLRPKEEGKN